MNPGKKLTSGKIEKSDSWKTGKSENGKFGKPDQWYHAQTESARTGYIDIRNPEKKSGQNCHELKRHWDKCESWCFLVKTSK